MQTKRLDLRIGYDEREDILIIKFKDERGVCLKEKRGEIICYYNATKEVVGYEIKDFQELAKKGYIRLQIESNESHKYFNRLMATESPHNPNLQVPEEEPIEQLILSYTHTTDTLRITSGLYVFHGLYREHRYITSYYTGDDKPVAYDISPLKRFNNLSKGKPIPIYVIDLLKNVTPPWFDFDFLIYYIDGGEYRDAERGMKGFNGESRLKGHTANVNSVAFSPDGKLLASGGDDGILILWDVERRKRLWRRKYNKIISSVTFSPDGRFLAVAKGSDIIVFNMKEREPLCELKDSAKPLSFCRGTFITFHPNGRLILSDGPDNTIGLWDIDKGEMGRIEDQSAAAMVFNPDGKSFITYDISDDTVRVWDTERMKEIRRVKLEEGGQDILGGAAAFSRDGKLLAAGESCGGAYIIIWDVTNGKIVLKIDPENDPLDPVLSLTFSPDRKRLIFGTEAGGVLGWDIEKNKGGYLALHGSWEAVYSVALSPDNRFLASGGEDGLRLKDLKYLEDMNSYGGRG